MLNIDDSLNIIYSEIKIKYLELEIGKNKFQENFEDKLSISNLNKNEDEKTISQDSFEDEPIDFNLNKNENEKNISQDILEEGSLNYCDNFNKNENEKTLSLVSIEDEHYIFNFNKNENEKIGSQDILEEGRQNYYNNFNKNENENENEKTISLDSFEDEPYTSNLNKNENEKNISLDILGEGRKNYCDNLNKNENENEKNFYNDKSNDNNEINKLSSNESFSPELYLDLSTEHGSLLSDGESKNDLVKKNSKISQINENPVINDKTILRKKVKKKNKKKNKNKNKNRYKRYIKSVNKSFSNSDNYDIKLMNPILENFILLKQNKGYYYMINEKFFNLKEAQAKDLDSQKSFSDYKYNNRSSLPNESESDSYSNNNGSNDNSDQSNGSSPLSTILEPNNTQSNNGLSFLIIARTTNEIEISDLFPITINNSENISELLPNENNYEVNIKILEIDKNGNKRGIFEIYKKDNKGRKKKNSEEIGKHTKISKDNMRSKAKTISLDFLLHYLNEKIKKIDINDLNKNPDWRLYKTKYVDNKTKAYNLNLLNQSLKSIFSAPISGRADKNENYNKDLIDKIYQINQEGNSEKTEKIIKFLNMKYKDFFNCVKIIKEQEKIQGIDEDIEDMVKDFYLFLEKNLSKDNKDKDYNQKLIDLIKNFPEDINNMKVKKK